MVRVDFSREVTALRMLGFFIFIFRGAIFWTVAYNAETAFRSVISSSAVSLGINVRGTGGLRGLRGSVLLFPTQS